MCNQLPNYLHIFVDSILRCIIWLRWKYQNEYFIFSYRIILISILLIDNAILRMNAIEMNVYRNRIQTKWTETLSRDLILKLALMLLIHTTYWSCSWKYKQPKIHIWCILCVKVGNINTHKHAYTQTLLPEYLFIGDDFFQTWNRFNCPTSYFYEQVLGDDKQQCPVIFRT